MSVAQSQFSSGPKHLNQDLLKQAIKTNDLDLFTYLLSKDPSLSQDSFNSGNLATPLHMACEYGRLSMAKKLVTEYGSDVNRVCPLTGFTPLMYAVQVGNYDIANFLVSKDVRADYKVRSVFTGRDALAISIDSHFDRITDLIEWLKYE